MDTTTFKKSILGPIFEAHNAKANIEKAPNTGMLSN